MESKPMDRESQQAPSDEATPSAILGLDVGDRRIGVAIAEERASLAQPLLTLERKNLRLDIRFLSRLLRKHRCREIVVGNPLYMSGDQSPQAAKTQAFATALGEATGIPIHLWDERLSTGEAHRYLDESGRDPRTRRSVIDQVAAVLILQGFLDARSAGARS
jgi:putative holliday junction resolvase